MLGIDPFGITISAAMSAALSGLQNAQTAYAPDGIATRLDAAKLALTHPDRVERLANGRGWRRKMTDAQLGMARLMQQYDPRRPPKGHDHPEWV
ncbi:hypothetical protein D3C71_351380 [compost metagenome]